MFSAFPPVRRTISDAELDRILRQPLPAYEPLPVDPRADLGHAPAEGGLAWLLAHGLSGRSVSQPWALCICRTW